MLPELSMIASTNQAIHTENCRNVIEMIYKKTHNVFRMANA